MTLASDWLQRAQQIPLPAILPVSSLPNSQAPLDEWMAVIREDPLMTIHLFRYANKMLASHDISVRTLDHAVSLLGNTRLISLTGKLPRVEEKSASAKGLLRAIGDSLLAASLMRQWFEIRQIPWTEADYWLTLFYDLAIWIGWIAEPEKMEGIEFRVRQGENREKLLQELFGQPLREWNQKLCNYYQLPIFIDGPDTSTNAERIQPFKQSALKFFLPFSHELAFTVRQSWQSDALDVLCRTGEISLGLTEFKPMLKRWVAVAAREFQLPHAAIAARRLIADQPHNSKPSSDGFSAEDLARVNQRSGNTKIFNNVPTLSEEIETDWPEAEQVEVRIKTEAKTPKLDSSADLALKPAPAAAQKRSVVDINVLREIRRQFRNRKSWHSPVEIQESALYGLRKGLNVTRIVAMEARDGFWQAFDSEGCQNHPLLRNLKIPMQSAEIISELSRRVTAVWVHEKNRSKAGKLLPPPMLAAAENESFFLRSFSIGTDITMLLYVDAYEQKENLNELDYQLFREFCADWNTALNKMTS